jgi:hypothetical protein
VAALLARVRDAGALPGLRFEDVQSVIDECYTCARPPIACIARARAARCVLGRVEPHLGGR